MRTCRCQHDHHITLPGVLLLSEHEAAKRGCWYVLRTLHSRQELSQKLYRPRHIKGGAVPNWLAAVRTGSVLPQPDGWPALEVIYNDTAQVRFIHMKPEIQCMMTFYS